MTDSEKIKSLEVQLLAAGKVLRSISRTTWDSHSPSTRFRWINEKVSEALTPDIQKLLKDDAEKDARIKKLATQRDGLLEALETLKWLIDMQADLKHRESQKDTNAYDKAVMALQLYYKKDEVK